MNNHFANILIEFNSYKITNEYIRSTLMKVDQNCFDFVVVDNSMNLENFEKLSNYYTKNYKVISFDRFELRIVNICLNNKKTNIIYVCNDKNAGFGAGANLGMRIAMKYFSPQFLLITCNDMICTDESIRLENIADIFCKNPNIGLIGVNIKNLDGSNQSPYRYVNFFCRWIIPELFFPFSLRFKNLNSNDIIQHCSSGIVYRIRGSYMVLRTDAFVKTGGFDENVFLYCEESILAEKLKEFGYSVYYYDDIHMLHNHQLGTSTLISDELKKIKRRFTSELYYYGKYKNTSKCQIYLSKALFKQYILKYKIYLKYRFTKE